MRKIHELARSLTYLFTLLSLLVPNITPMIPAAFASTPTTVTVDNMNDALSMSRHGHSWEEHLKALGIDPDTYGSDPNNPTAPQGSVSMPFDGAPLLSPVSETSLTKTASSLPVVPPERTKTYNITATSVFITINRFGDNEPNGFMYILNENIPAMRIEEAKNKLFNPVVTNLPSLGLRDDLIQPLVIRANVGDMVVVNFTNGLSAGRASINISGLEYDIASHGSHVGLNSDSMVDPGQTITYRWFIPDKVTMEGSYVFTSMGDRRAQQAHGLFGVLNVEPRGSTYLNPINGQPLKSGWDAMIVDPNGKDFREDTIIYHEFGDETYQLKDKNGTNMPLNDFVGAYRPGARAINYRSEPFFRRQELAEASALGHDDESQSYGSYMFGDPATTIPRGYIGDPTKRRIVNGGSERFHMEHLHGGSDRWRFDPFVEPDQWGLPFDKHPSMTQSLSQRLDVQSVGPGEAYSALPEGAAGGLQAGAGEWLFHCHFCQHYIGGMWGFWRVFDTLQTAQTTLPGEPVLAELPDRVGRTPLAVDSRALIGKKLPGGRTLVDGPTTATTKNIDEWMRSVLPPQGDPGPEAAYDASVWNWTRQSTSSGWLYLGEPETSVAWVNYNSPTPGVRPPILFNPNNMRPAFPLLRPHLGRRPPFSPNRSGSPWLGEPTQQAGPERGLPDADHPDSLIPSDARRIQYTAVAVPMPITFNAKFNMTDPAGALQVLDEDKDDILAGIKPKEQLTIRANVGDGVDITYYSEETDAAFFDFAKTNIHIHFVQFDTQASDGVISGFSYDQSIRPYKTEGAAGTGIRLASAAFAGSNTITLDANGSTLKVNAFIGIGFGVPAIATNGFEFAQIVLRNGNVLTLDRPLQKDHPAGQFVGTEFVRYQWYADVEEGTTFFHDHVFGIGGFGKALTGSLIVEPKDSLWLDPVTGAPKRSGTIVDIITNRQAAPGVPIQSFREFVLHQMGAITALDGKGESLGQPGGFNMKQEPITKGRLTVDPDPSLVFSSVRHGDPETPLLRAYVGDLVAIRLMNSSGHDMSAFHLAGHRFRQERFDAREAPRDSISSGIAERFDLFFTAGGLGRVAGDYVYMNAMEDKMLDGAWGILRLFDTLQPNLRTLRLPVPPSGPGFPQNTVTGGRPPAANDTGTIIVPGTPVREFNVVAIQKNIQFSNTFSIANGRAYVLAEDKDAVIAGTKPLEPLVIRANVGEAVKINFKNELPTARASLHISQLTKTTDSLGSAFGFDNDSTVAPGATTTYWYMIDPAFEVPRAFAITDYGDPANGPMSGLYGAFIVTPAGSTFHDPRTGVAVNSGATVDIRNPNLPGGGYRDVALLFHDDDPGMNRDVMPYRKDVTGIRGINYKAEPFTERLAADADISHVFRTEALANHGDPRTPIIQATNGDTVRLHVMGGAGKQPHSFGMEGHTLPFDNSRDLFMDLPARQFGPMNAFDTKLAFGAGGSIAATGDYLYSDRRNAFLEAGLWGIMRINGPAQAAVLPVEQDLVPGWNLVSRHVVPTTPAPSAYLSSISGKFDKVAIPDPVTTGAWLTFAPGVATSTLTALDQTEGFWIHMATAAFLAPQGTLPVVTDIQLKKGWNLAGWPSLKTLPVDQALASIAGKYDRVYQYEATDPANPWKVFDPAAPLWVNDLAAIRPLKGYWILMNADATLRVNP